MLPHCSPLLLLSGTSSLAAQASRSSEPPLRVAFGTVPEPLLIPSEQGTPQGLIPAFWEVWSRYADREILLVPYDTNGEARDAVRNGEADFLASLPITHLPEPRSRSHPPLRAPDPGADQRKT